MTLLKRLNLTEISAFLILFIIYNFIYIYTSKIEEKNFLCNLTNLICLAFLQLRRLVCLSAFVQIVLVSNLN